MQDRYVGDVGDFGKYGLLRWLFGENLPGPALRLGALWYRFEDTTPGDGKHIKYLELQGDSRFRECDPKLFAKLRSIVCNERSIAAVEASRVFPVDTVFFPKTLTFEKAERKAVRTLNRHDWLAEGLKAVADADRGFRRSRQRFRGPERWPIFAQRAEVRLLRGSSPMLGSPPEPHCLSAHRPPGDGGDANSCPAQGAAQEFQRRGGVVRASLSAGHITRVLLPSRARARRTAERSLRQVPCFVLG